MKFLKATLAATAVTAFAMSAQAQDSNVYVNVGVQSYQFDTYNVLGRVGYNFGEYFGVEGEGSVGFAGETEDGIDFDTTYALGGFLIGKYPLSDQFDVFGRVGYTTTRLKADNGFDSDSENFEGVAVGGGLQYNFGDNGIRLGYTYQDLNGGLEDTDVYDISYVRRF